jgi:hypothetical protein
MEQALWTGARELLVCFYSLCYVLEVEEVRETKPEIQDQEEGKWVPRVWRIKGRPGAESKYY